MGCASSDSIEIKDNTRNNYSQNQNERKVVPDKSQTNKYLNDQPILNESNKKIFFIKRMKRI